MFTYLLRVQPKTKIWKSMLSTCLPLQEEGSYQMLVNIGRIVWDVICVTILTDLANEVHFCQLECKEASPSPSSSLEWFPPLLSEPTWFQSYQKVGRVIQPANVELINLTMRNDIYDFKSRYQRYQANIVNGLNNNLQQQLLGHGESCLHLWMGLTGL